MDEAREKSGMSTGMKALIATLVIGGICVLVCCGGGFYFLKNNMNQTTNPQEIQAIQESILKIDIPDEYRPASGIQMSLGAVSFNMAIYQPQDGIPGEILLIMETPGGGQMTAEEREKAFKNQSQNAQQGTADIDVIESETRTISLQNAAGEETEVEFTFESGTLKDSEQVVHRVVGFIPTGEKLVMLHLLQAEENWNEEQAMSMLESIEIE